MEKERKQIQVRTQDTEEASENPLGNNKEEKKEDRPPKKDKPLEKMSKSELLEKIEALGEESKKQYDLYLRSQAEYENVKKRHRKEKEDWIKYANETLIKELLPVMDNLEMALTHTRDENSIEALREGVDLTLKGLKDALVKAGLEEIRAKGEPFDPNFHEAVSQQEDPDADPDVNLHELQKGYLLNKRLIRPAMVVVNKTRTKGRENEQNDRPDDHA